MRIALVLACALCSFPGLSFVTRAVQSGEIFSPASGHSQVIAQGVAPMPDEAAWRVVFHSIDPGGAAELSAGGPGFILVDTGARAGTNVTVYYDPMIAKLISWGEDRAAAIETMGDALQGITVEGVKTNIPFLQRILAGDDFAAGRIHTRYVDERLNEIMAG